MIRASNENLDILIEGLEEYQKAGVKDDWVLNTGETISPLEVLRELRELRDARMSYNTKVENALAHVIDDLYLSYKPTFKGEHNLGAFKEHVKSAFHEKLSANPSDL